MLGYCLGRLLKRLKDSGVLRLEGALIGQVGEYERVDMVIRERVVR